jgi:hypothetical protein
MSVLRNDGQITSKNTKRMSLLERIVEAFSWIQIAASPIVIAGICGGLVWLTVGGAAGAVLGLAILALGFFAGYLWAENIRRKEGAHHFMSRLNASSDLDRKEQKQPDKAINDSGNEAEKPPSVRADL